MPNLTTNYSFNLPLVNDPVDEDLWGGQLNTNWTNLDSILTQLVPIGAMLPYAGTSSPNSRWLLCDGSAVSRTTYATLFALISTSYGVGDGSTTFNLPDYRGRTGVGLDNLGGTPANRVTNSNADNLNNTGFGDETPSGSLSGSTDAHTLTTSEIPSQSYEIGITADNSGTVQAQNGTAFARSANASAGGNYTSANAIDVWKGTNYVRDSNGGGSHDHDLTSATVTGAAGDNLQPGIAEGRIIRAL